MTGVFCDQSTDIADFIANVSFLYEGRNRIMIGISKKVIYPAGIDLNSCHLKVSQLGLNNKGLFLNAGAIEAKPDDVEFGSADWQRWVVGMAKTMFARGGFSGKGVVASIPSENIFIEHIKVNADVSEVGVEKAVLSKIKTKLPFDPNGAMVNYVVTGSSENGKETDVLVMAAEREVVNHQLAIYEKAGLEIKGISVWPLAMTNSYVKFFAQRKADVDVVAMLIDIDVTHTKVVISKQADLLFARLIPVGTMHLGSEEAAIKLVSETDACCRYFESMSQSNKVERLVFFSGRSANEVVCERVSRLAERLQIPAQIGDVLAAVEIESGCDITVDRRGCQVDWAIAFGLSLTNLN
jgi:type IV pilus assembly protein PilM